MSSETLLTLTPRSLIISIKANTSRMAGMLLMVTSSAVSNTAQSICSASFFAPCGVMAPFSFFPPVTSNEFGISFLFHAKEENAFGNCFVLFTQAFVCVYSGELLLRFLT